MPVCHTQSLSGPVAAPAAACYRRSRGRRHTDFLTLRQGAERERSGTIDGGGQQTREGDLKAVQADDEKSIPNARPAATLDGAAADVWEAYNAMETTKRRHFGLLETLDLKKRNYNLDPTADESRLLGWLLADHDAQVRRFTAASLALKVADAAAHGVLFDYIGAIDRIGAGAGGDPEARRTH